MSVSVILILILVYLAFVLDMPYRSTVNNFVSCVAAGNQVLESFPRQCRDRDGTLYVESVATADLSRLIQVAAPVPGALVSSPVSFSGKARGPWYFEGSFPVTVRASDGSAIGSGIAEAKGEWMTLEFVPFTGAVSFTKTPTATGTLVFHKENPSGDPALDLSYTIPVSFTSEVVGSAPCVVSGCSSEICAETEMMSTCAFRPEYACYARARCERQASGSCGWTKTADYRACITTLSN